MELKFDKGKNQKERLELNEGEAEHIKPISFRCDWFGLIKNASLQKKR